MNFSNLARCATAGLAIAEFEQENFEEAGSENFTLTGFSVGAGVDWPVTENLVARVEILHDDYGRKETIFNGYSGDWTDTTQYKLQTTNHKPTLLASTPRCGFLRLPISWKASFVRLWSGRAMGRRT